MVFLKWKLFNLLKFILPNSLVISVEINDAKDQLNAAVKAKK